MRALSEEKISSVACVNHGTVLAEAEMLPQRLPELVFRRRVPPRQDALTGEREGHLKTLVPLPSTGHVVRHGAKRTARRFATPDMRMLLQTSIAVPVELSAGKLSGSIALVCS